MSRVLITGATAGIGRETARALVAKDHEVVIACRNLAKGENVAAAIRDEFPRAKLELVELDLASFASVRRCAEDVKARFPVIDVLINNAGGVNVERKLSVDGHELTFATNHLGPFLFTNLLLDRLREAPAGRVVTVASNSHYSGKIDFQDLQHEKRYGVYKVYCDTKLANVLFALKLARLLVGSRVTSNALHPGTVASDIWPSDNALLRAATPLLKRFMLDERAGAEPSVMLATDPRLNGVNGRYFSRLAERAPSRKARDIDLQDALWQVSLRMTGL